MQNTKHKTQNTKHNKYCLLYPELLISSIIVLHLYLYLYLYLILTYLFFISISEFTLKRVGIRTAIMVFCLLVCLTIPHFEPILSLTGGLPHTFIGIIIPIVTSIKLFPPAKYVKIMAYIFILGTTAVVAGNLVATLQQIFTMKI